MRDELFIGLMSGTSADGVDAVVSHFSDGRFQRVEASLHRPHPPTLRESLIALGRNAGASLALADLAALDVAVARQFATVVDSLLKDTGLHATQIRAIGSHGQTIFHDPRGIGSSLQIGDPNLIAALTGIPVVADFRRMDVALGGEGAPLVPAFHQAVFAGPERTAVINIGGIANITLLDGTHPTLGFDCGPGNALMDEWAMRHLGRAYDADGAFAASGTVLPVLLAAWMRAPYFAAPAPKSTGRAQFNLDWAESLAGDWKAYSPADVQASLCELTVRTIADAVQPAAARVMVCGGGAKNRYLMQRLSHWMPQSTLSSTDVAGLAPEWVEAAAFAWLAHQRIHGLPGNLPSVTGASRSALLGGIYG